MFKKKSLCQLVSSLMLLMIVLLPYSVFAEETEQCLDKDNAISAYTKAINLNPQNVEVYQNRGNYYLFKGQYDAAIADYKKAIELNPQYAEAYYKKAFACLNGGYKSEAIQGFKLFLQYAPSNNNDIVTAKQELINLVAIADYSKAIELNSQDANAYYGKAFACFKLGYDSEAIQAYKLFIKYATSGDPFIEKAKQQIRELGGTI